MKEINWLCSIGALKWQPSSKWALPTFVIPKKDGAVHTNSNFRKLNKRIVRKPYPIPQIGTILPKLEGLTYTIALDCSRLRRKCRPCWNWGWGLLYWLPYWWDFVGERQLWHGQGGLFDMAVMPPKSPPYFPSHCWSLLFFVVSHIYFLSNTIISSMHPALTRMSH